MERKDPRQRDHRVASGSSDPQPEGEERAERERLASMLDPANQLLTLRYLLPEEPEAQTEAPDVVEAA